MTRIIAITGGSGAGKTTLARALGRQLDAAVVAEDDYYQCASVIADFDAATHNFDTPLAKDHALLLEHMTAARAGVAFDKPVYDLASHRRLPIPERINPGAYLIVEGIHLLTAPELRAAFDVSVFIDADEALRLGRRMIRDVEARGRTPRAVMAQFFASVRPMHEAHVEPQRAIADIVLASTHESGPGSAATDAARVAAALEALA
jgi:uridine kinase